MAVRPVLEYPDPRLRRSAQPVTVFDSDLPALIDDLLDTFRASTGIGLCAPQLGDSRRVVVLDASAERLTPTVFINPEILKRRTMCFVQEQCLSVPGLRGLVRRHAEIAVRAQDRHGATFECELTNMEAVCLQHEIDHLDGVLFVDRLAWWRRLWFRRVAQRRAHAGATAA